ncbi:MAG: carboxylesterase family protein [Bryobacteraceae bacterium]
MLLCTLSMAACLFAQVPPSVEMTGGTLRGYLAAPGAVFKAIPYAAPPVGELRWREPQPVQPWHGVRDATRYAAACVQIPTGTGAFLAPLARRYGVTYATPRWDLSEDCLYLNIWTPEWPAKEPHAVMFWMHGGSNRIGSGNEAGYDGAELAKRGVVVVTINYRLGALGFFAHPELTRESPHRASGNYGLLDQIAALGWVHDHIAQFGGDPTRVTVFGESAGAIDAGMLMCSPLAGGLFARAIIESGPVVGIAYAHSLRQAEQYGERVARMALPVLPAPSIARLRALPAEAILKAAAAAAKQEANPEFVLDGWVLQRTPQAVFAAGSELPVALMIGNNGREASVFRGSSATSLAADQGPKKTLRISYGSLAPIAVAAFAIDDHTGRAAAADEWLNDALMTCPADAMAALNAAAGRASFVYQFRRSIPGKGESTLGSFHSLELPYVFGQLRNPVWSSWLAFGKPDEALAEAIEGYWTNFAKTGDPNGGGLPEWRRYTQASDQYMEFGNDGRVRSRAGARPTFCSLDLLKLKQRLMDNQ